MIIYAIVLTEASAEVDDRIKNEYPKRYKLNDTFYLVRSENISEEVAVNVGIKGDDRVEDVTGVVFRLNGAYAGYAPTSLWDWLTTEG